MGEPMDASAFRIAIVDDEEFFRLATLGHLEDEGFPVDELSSGVAFLQRYLEAPPELVVLDIEMDGLDGYQVCRRLRAAGHDDVQVIFVSAHDDLSSRLESYEAGGNDFISKPLQPEELLKKVHQGVTNRRRLEQLRLAAHSADEMSQLALNSMDEASLVQKFLRSLLGPHTLESLAKLMLDTLAAYGCSSVVQLRTAWQELTLNVSGPASPLEQSILEQTQKMERIFQFRSRMIVNFERISILITDMPLEDEARAGRIRDYVAVLAEALDAAIAAVAVRQDIINRAQDMQSLVRESQQTIAELNQNYMLQQTSTHSELERMTASVENMYYKLGLTGVQEAIISDLVRSAADRILELFAQGQESEAKFAAILQQLDRVSRMALERPLNTETKAEVWL